MGRAPCCDKTKVKRGPWSPDEDRVLVSYITNNGVTNWKALPQEAGLARCGKSCRLRWVNYLRPDVKRGPFTMEEEERIMKLHETLGNQWSKIASYFPGRTDNEIKNVWKSYFVKKLAKTGSNLLPKIKKGAIHNKNESNKNMSGNSPFSQASSSLSSISIEGKSPNGLLGIDPFDPFSLQAAMGNFQFNMQADISREENWPNGVIENDPFDPLILFQDMGNCQYANMQDDIFLDVDWLNNLDSEDPFPLLDPIPAATGQAVSAESSLPFVPEVGGDGNKETLGCDQEWVNYLENLPEDQLTNEVFDDDYFASLFSPPSPK